MAAEDGGVNVNVTFQDEVSSRIEAMASSLGVGKLNDALEEIGSSNITETEQRFEAQRTPQGTRWQDLSDETKKRRRAQGKTKMRILRDGGELYDSLTYKLDGMAVRVGSNRAYARIHQLGGKAGKHKSVTIKPRPYLGVSAEGGREILQILEDHVQESQR